VKKQEAINIKQVIMQKRSAHWRIAFFFMCVLVGCNHPQLQNDKKIFRYNQSSDISSLDPAYVVAQSEIWAVHQIFNGLVQLDSKLNIVPCIAKHWTISADGLTYTFYLRADVYFQDDSLFANGKGRSVTAQDFVYSLNRIIDPAVASKGAWIFNDKVDKSNPFVAVNDSVFQINLKRPFSPMLGILTMQYCDVVPKEIVEHYGREFAHHPVGTGPFSFKLWKPEEVLILSRNNNYFERDSAGNRFPYIDGVSVSFVSTKQTEFLKFLQGDLDFISDVDASFKDVVLTKDATLQPKYADKIYLDKSEYLNTEYLGILQQPVNRIPNPLLKLNVRQALSYAIDRQSSITYLRNGVGIPAYSGFVPEGISSFDSSKVKGYNYNPEKAKQLLSEAGYPNGNGLPEIVLSASSLNENSCLLIEKDLQNVGFKVRLDIMQGKALREMMMKQQVILFRGSWIADYPDAENYLACFYSKNDAPPNYTRFKSRTFDKLYDEAMSTTNDSLKNNLYQKMDQLVMDSAVIVPLYYDEVIRFIRKNISGLKNNPQNLLDLRTVRIK
jgi:oligopeptide transport system substrate-binding protein